MATPTVLKKASVNGQPALVESQSSRFAKLPGFHSYLEIDCGSVIGAVNGQGETIPLSWQPIAETDRVHLEQDLKLG